MLSVVFIVDAIVFDSLKLALTLFFGLIFFRTFTLNGFKNRQSLILKKIYISNIVCCRF